MVGVVVEIIFMLWILDERLLFVVMGVDCVFVGIF